MRIERRDLTLVSTHAIRDDKRRLVLDWLLEFQFSSIDLLAQRLGTTTRSSYDFFRALLKQRLDERGITHWWTYPRSPKMNAHAERFNRTLQEQFVDYHENLLFDDLAAFNRNLADWLLAYNTVLPHHSLDRQSPVQFLMQHQPECQRWWTHTTD